MTFQRALLLRGVPYRLGGDRNKLLLNCPFCPERGKGTDTKFRLCVHLTQHWGRCLHCDWKSRGAMKPVLRQLGIQEEVEGIDHEDRTAPPLPELPRDFLPLTKASDELDKIALRYVLHRGITLDQIRRCRVGVSYSGRYAYRIVFPVYVNKELKGINARAFMGKGEPKYLNSLGEKWLFNFDPTQEITVLSEGVFKALRIESACKHGSAALLGHDLTDNQLSQIRDSQCKRVILYHDPDRSGISGTTRNLVAVPAFIRIADKLCESWGGEVYFAHPVRLPADEAPLEELSQLINNPLTYSWGTRQRILSNF